MAVKLATLVKKNLTLLGRRRSSAIIVVLGPLLLIILMSVAFNTASVYSLIVGVSPKTHTALTTSLLDALKDKHMSIVETETKDSCVDGVKKGLFNVCAVFPDDFDVEHGGTVTFYVDKSRENLVYIVVEYLQSEVQKKSKQIGEQLATDVIETLVTSGESLSDKQKLLDEMSTNSRSVADTAEKLHSLMLHANVSASLSVFPFEQLQAEINELKGSSNTSTAADEYLANIRARADALVKAVNTYDTVKSGALRDLTAIKVLVDENLGYITVLDTNLDEVLMDIRSVKMQSAGKIVSPLDTKIESVLQEKSRLNFLFPTLVALIVMFVGLFLASSLEVRERSEHVAFKNMITPTSRWVFVLANFITSMLVIFAQLLIIFAVAFFFFKEQLTQVFFPVIGMLLLIASVFALLGMFIGMFFKSPETTVVGALSVGFVFLFLSSIVLPVEAMPVTVAKIIPYNPFYAAQFILSKLLLFQSSLKELLPMILTLSVWFIGLAVLVLMIASFRRSE